VAQQFNATRKRFVSRSTCEMDGGFSTPFRPITAGHVGDGKQWFPTLSRAILYASGHFCFGANQRGLILRAPFFQGFFDRLGFWGRGSESEIALHSHLEPFASCG
jgi:hypothetical protein